MIDITIFTKYTSQGASSRYRYFLYVNDLLKEDVNIEIDSFLDTSYLHNLYSKNKKNSKKIIFSYFKRLFSILNSSENLIIEYEVFPYLPYFLEKLFLRNKKYILNFDDNAWDNYSKNSLLKNKFNDLVKNASGVIVANSFLEQKVFKLNQNLIKIPTVVDLEHYNKEATDKFSKFTIVWIGSKITYKYIKSHKNIFIRLAENIDYQLVIVASKNLYEDKIDGVDMKFYNWSSKVEVDILKKSHIGIMPLDNDSFSQGKSSFKLIQYLASGLPSVASDVGENKNVIKDNKTGFLANSESEWIDCIVNLCRDKDLYQTMSKHAVLDSYEYSIQKYFVKFNTFIQKIFQ